MKISDIFKPEYKKSDPRKRLEAVKTLTDQNILYEIVSTDESWEVKKNAIDKINRLDLLIDIFKFDDVRISRQALQCLVQLGSFTDPIESDNEVEYFQTCLGNIGDPSALSKIASESKNASLRNSTISIISDQILLRDIVIASTSFETAKNALDKVTDERALVRIIQSDQVFDIQKIALKKISSSEILSKIAQTNSNMNIRNAALKKITEPNLLAKILIENWKDENVGQAIWKLFTDEVLLSQIALRSNNEKIQLEAVERIKDPIMLFEIETKSKKWDIRSRAANKLEKVDDFILANIAISNSDQTIRIAALDKITKLQNLANSIIKLADGYELDQNIWSKINDEELLSMIALRSENIEVASEATSKIKAPSILFKIVSDSDSPTIRRKAATQISDFNYISEVVKSGQKMKELEIIAANLVDQDILEHIAENTTSKIINDIVKKRLKEISTEIIRSTSKSNLSGTEMAAIIRNANYYERCENENGVGINHDFVIVEKENSKLVVDQATMLMWNCRFSDDFIPSSYLKSYIEMVNIQEFAGYSNWRLPTLEETLTLMEPQKTPDRLGLKIDDSVEFSHLHPLLGKAASMIWTSDLGPSSLGRWVLREDVAEVFLATISMKSVSVRLVRNLYNKEKGIENKANDMRIFQTFRPSTEENNLIDKAVKLANQKQFPIAIGIYNKILSKDPRNSVVYNNKGFCLAKSGMHDQAIECYNIAIEIDPAYLTVVRNKGASLEKLNKFDEACECFESVLKVNPGDSSAFDNLIATLKNQGKHLKDSKNFDRAIKCFNKALELNPEDEGIWLGKVEVYFSTGDKTKAIEYCNEGLKRIPSSNNLKKFKEMLGKISLS